MASNYYETLGVTANASTKEIRSAYRKLARRFHPDINPNNQVAAARFKEIQLAYDVLGNDEKKKKYDIYGDRWNEAEQYSQAQQHSGFNRGDFGDIGSIFEGFFGGGRNTRRVPQRGNNIDVTAEITLEEAANGTARTISLNSQSPCEGCSGQGYVTANICPSCRGRGQTERPKRLEVKIPPGVETGSRIRIQGEGSPGYENGPTGDLYLNINVQPHKTFERAGNNLITEVSISFLDAILGGEVEAPTINGRVRVTVPELTQSDQKIRLRGKGMPVLNANNQIGDLFVKIKIELPKQISANQRQLFEQLRSQNTEVQHNE
tara:strand:- start:8292 stop:9251 length:960 start_codon:yes stop_codon:yes gene_type:complete